MNKEIIVEKFLLEEFNLSHNETTIYLALLKSGPSTILEISDQTGINRATVHVNIDYLTKKNLVTQLKKGRGARRFIMAEPPDRLEVILKEKKARLEAAEHQLGSIIQELSQIKAHTQHENGIDIRHYRGKEEVRFIYEEALKTDEIRTYFNCSIIDKFFPLNEKNFIKALATNKNMQIWEIMEDSKIAREYASKIPKRRYYCKLTTKNFAPVDCLIFDGKVAIITLDKNVEGAVIENEPFYQSAKAIHKFVWQFLPVNKNNRCPPLRIDK